MIDHVSVGVSDLVRSTRFYELVLAELGYRVLKGQERTVGFGKEYPEFWLNHRPELRANPDSGSHVCLRARSVTHVEAFYRVALENGARGEGSPGLRPAYHPSYYAAFIRDFDENLVEVVTFVERAVPTP